MRKGISKDLIRKYLKGESTSKEIGDIHEWYDSFEKESDPLLSLSAKEQEELKQRMLGRIKGDIGKDLKRGRLGSDKKVRKLIYSLSAVAAIFLLLVTMPFLYQKGSPTLSSSLSRDIVIVNKTGAIQKYTLSDGSTIWLSPQAEVKYPRTFELRKREVKMTGEAFFEVTKDVNRPFIIYSGGVITRVWGTSFRIRGFKGTAPTEVSVVTGKVSVSIPKVENSEVMLFPKQKAIYSKQNALLKKDTEAESSMKIWNKTDITFDNVPLKEIMKNLNARFGVEIKTQDEVLNDYVLKADFTDQNLPEILRMLEKSLNITYRIKGKEIILTNKINSHL